MQLNTKKYNHMTLQDVTHTIVKSKIKKCFRINSIIKRHCSMFFCKTSEKIKLMI